VADVDADSLAESRGDYRADAGFEEVAASEAVELEVESKLAKLADYFSRQLQGTSSEFPSFVSGSFEGAGIDRALFRERFSGEQINIGRWQATDSAPKFVGASALTAFMQNVLGNWKQAEKFGLEFKIYQTESTGEEVTVRVVVESFGQTEKEKGVQATSLWETRWTSEDGEDLALKSLKVLGCEELIVDVTGGQLLQDCSESVFGKCEAWDTQLKYGLDQWSRQIPGLSAVGTEGIAVGDINGDGLDDLYVCQGHGLANLLLLQNPDGTVRNIAGKAGLDLLDETRAALILDLDNDGDQDLVLSTDECVALYSNNANETFRLENKLPIGYDSSSLSASDFDLDGDLDLLICKYRSVREVDDFLQVPASFVESQSGGRNVLLRNDEGWQFTDATEESGLTENNFGHSRSATWVDFDLDGDLDLFVANEWSSPRLYRNQNGWFSDVTEKAELRLPSQSRSVSIGDFNRDARPDLFLANEASSRQYRVIKSKRDSNAIDSASAASLLAQSHVWFSKRESRDRDGKEDLSGLFSGYPLPTPVFTTESSFGSAVADLNNDGLEDIVVANGYLSRTSSDDLQSFWASCIAHELGTGESNPEELRLKADEVSDMIRCGFSMSGNQRNRCYLNMGAIGFANFSACSGVDLLNDARAIATTDWDNDGDIDIVMTSRTGPRIRVLCNQMDSKNESIGLKLVGTSSNRDAIGARIEVWLAGERTPIVRWVGAESGYLAQSSRSLRIGVGSGSKISKVDIQWPGGKRQSFTGLKANRTYKLVENVLEAAEQSTKRFDLKIAPAKLAGNVELPAVRRSVFFPTSVLPRIGVEAPDGVRYRIQSSAEEALLAVFHDGQSESVHALTDLASNATSITESGLGCVAVCCARPGAEGSFGEQLSRSGEALEESAWPWPGGFVSAKDQSKLRLACGEWFNHQHLPRMPFAILLDRTGSVKAFYPTDEISSLGILRDKVLFNRGYGADWKKLTDREGRWLDRGRTENLTRLKDRFLSLGLEEEAKYINRMIAPGTAFQLAMRGVELTSQNELEQAEVFLDRAISVYAGCVTAHIHKGNLYRKFAARLPTEDSDRGMYLDAAAASFVNALNVDPRNEEAAIGFADANADQNNALPAIEKLEEFLQTRPESARVHAILGRLYFAKRKYMDAATHLTQAFDKHPTLPYVAGDLGYLYLGSGEASRGRKFLRLAHRLQPGDQTTLRYLAESELATGNYESAIKLFGEYLKGAPKHLRSNLALAWMLSTSPYEGMRDAERALELMEPILQVYGEDSAYVQEVVAACHADNGDFALASTVQKKALNMVSNQKTSDKYSDAQIEGLKERLNLYSSGVPYLTDDLNRIPIRKIGAGLKPQ
jgi:tetratricopeptide (TPR) repeat protein